MAVTKTTYSADAAIVATNWESLVADDWATLPNVDNTSNLYIDMLVGGQIDLDTTTGTITAGESFDIYVAARFDKDVTTSYTGGIDTAFTAGDSSITADTEFNPLNLIFLTSVSVEATTPDVSQGYNWGPVSIAAAFGGILPQHFMLVGHNNTGATTTAATSTTIINTVGITYTST
ncbi:MAG: hypothetical protein V3T88_03675 [Nitrosomonadaceae bacterium]